MNSADDNMPATLTDLPDEILLEIISYFQVARGFLPDADHETQRRQSNQGIVRTLHALTLTCRRLNSLTMPELYRCIIQPYCSFFTTRLLLRTLLARRELTAYIHYFESQLPWDESEKHPMWKEAYPDSDLTHLMQCLPSAKWTGRLRGFDFDHLQWHNWDNGRRNLWTAFLSHWQTCRGEFGGAILVALAENLVDLALAKGRYMLHILEFKQYNQPCGLRRVCLGNLWYYELDTTVVTAIPASQDVSVAGWLRATAVTGYVDRYDPSKLKVKDLAVDNCNLSRVQLCDLLTSCPFLQNFTCRWASHDRPQKIDLPHLYGALTHHKHCLESLTIDTLESSWLVSMDDDVPPLGSLRDFTALKHLDVCGLVIWGDVESTDYARLSSVLPESLETLVIKMEWEDEAEYAFFDLLEDLPAMLPRLKSVDCTWRPAPRAVAEYFIKAFDEVGVRVTLDPTDDES